MVFCFILGAIVFLIMVHPVAFWLLFVPIVLAVGIAIVNWLKQ